MFSIVDHLNLDPSFILNLQKEGEKMLDFLATEKQQSWHEINLLLCSEEEIRKFNTKFLGKNKPTDVLTFNDTGNKAVSGDVALCLSQVFANAERAKLPRGYVFYETILHGFLHLYGLEHDYLDETLRELYQKQRKLLKQMNPDYSLIDTI